MKIIKTLLLVLLAYAKVILIWGGFIMFFWILQKIYRWLTVDELLMLVGFCIVSIFALLEYSWFLPKRLKEWEKK
jgi:hypothetical protein